MSDLVEITNIPYDIHYAVVARLDNVIATWWKGSTLLIRLDDEERFKFILTYGESVTYKDYNE